MEHKYIINLIFQQPQFSESGEIDLVTKTTSFGYENDEDANEAYDEFNTRKYLEISTVAGKMTFNVLSVELIDIKKYDKYKNEQELSNEESENEVNNENV